MINKEFTHFMGKQNGKGELILTELQRYILTLANKIVEILKDSYKERLTSVCLFGSSVRGTLRDGSDIDFLVVIKEVKMSYHKRIKEIIPLLDAIRALREYEELENFKLHIEPCFLVFTADEIKDHPPILLDISQEGLILFDKENFLRKQLTQVKEALVRLGSRKKITPHGHYWTLKPDIKPGEIINI